MAVAIKPRRESFLARVARVLNPVSSSPTRRAKPCARLLGREGEPLDAVDCVRLSATIERQTARGWEPVGADRVGLSAARFSPGIPPAWAISVPADSVFRAGDRLVIGGRIFRPVVVSRERRTGERQVIALED